MKLRALAVVCVLVCGLVLESVGLYIASPSVAVAAGGRAPEGLTKADATELPPDPRPVTDSPTSVESPSLPPAEKVEASEVSVTLTDATSSRVISAEVGGSPMITATLAPTEKDATADFPPAPEDSVPTESTAPGDTVAPTETSPADSTASTDTTEPLPDTTVPTESTAPTDTTTPPDGGEKPESVEPVELDVQVLSTDAALEYGLDWLAFTMTKTNVSKTDTIRLSIDYSSMRYAFGGDWADRLQLVRLANCGNVAPKLCDADPEVMTLVSNDVVNSILTVEVSLTRQSNVDGGGIASHAVTRRALVEECLDGSYNLSLEQLDGFPGIQAEVAAGFRTAVRIYRLLLASGVLLINENGNLAPGEASAADFDVELVGGSDDESTLDDAMRFTLYAPEPGMFEGCGWTCVIVTGLTGVLASGMAGAACAAGTVATGGVGSAAICGGAATMAISVTGLAYEASSNPGLDGGDVVCTLIFGPSNPAANAISSLFSVGAAGALQGGSQAVQELGRELGLRVLQSSGAVC